MASGIQLDRNHNTPENRPSMDAPDVAAAADPLQYIAGHLSGRLKRQTGLHLDLLPRKHVGAASVDIPLLLCGPARTGNEVVVRGGDIPFARLLHGA